MQNFTFHNPTKIIFGQDIIENIGTEAKYIGSNVLIIIGKGSVKNSGLLARVVSLLNMHNVTSQIFEGIKSNPTYQDADNATAKAKAMKADMILAIGGGSVIDTAKAVCAGYFHEGSVWDFYMNKAKCKQALPLLTILTLAATGTEMNPYTVLQDTKGGTKKGWGSPLLYPKLSFLDPKLTYSVPSTYTAYGIADLIAHALETYFSKNQNQYTNHTTAALIKVAVENGKKLNSNLEDYDARANIMWAATNALNGTLAVGRAGGDWGCHALEHSLSVLYDIPHGAGLSIIFPAWMKHFEAQNTEKLAFLSQNVFDGKPFIAELEKFFTQIGTPTRLSEVNILSTDKSKIIDNFVKNKASGMVHALEVSDYENILKNAW